jgi:cytochrome c5
VIAAHRAVAAALLALAACTAAQSTDAAGPASSGSALQLSLDDSIQKACAVTEQTCTRCHDLGKVRVTRLGSAREWRQLVLRMRRRTGSGITRNEVRAAETCLVYQDLGERGLADLRALGEFQ